VFGKSALAAWLRDKRPRSPPSIAQAVQAVPFRVTPWHRFLAVFNGSSCNVELPSAHAPGAVYEVELLSS